MNLDLSQAEQGLMAKVLGSYLSELRQTIAATKRGTSELHAEEDMLNDILAKVAPRT